MPIHRQFERHDYGTFLVLRERRCCGASFGWTIVDGEFVYYCVNCSQQFSLNEFAALNKEARHEMKEVSDAEVIPTQTAE